MLFFVEFSGFFKVFFVLIFKHVCTENQAHIYFFFLYICIVKVFLSWYNQYSDEKGERKHMKTRKKVKVVGTEKYIKQETGEIAEMQVIEIEERDANFHKLWLGHILQSIDLIGNQKTKLAFWILEHLDSENQLVMTQRRIAEKSGISLDTVRLTMKALMESNFLVKINSGAYRVNPDVMFRGGKDKRLNILMQYREEEVLQNGDSSVKRSDGQIEGQMEISDIDSEIA